MKLWALSDLHVNHRGNLDALAELPSYGEDWGDRRGRHRR